ncbi:hypothetical protein [Sphingobacterium multivorum]|uniref:hypothetical protein n=2 Tax=Sphingobacterium multivorum TaxID=28454 RepID=UPI000E8712CE|nr:hypothetical protein [Sphingobacterium multivorum]HAU54237.1 hypothetical protein [Sphingobacterium sp.]HCX57575.1 hypothetical protein [Sphingobacterium sp.]
MEMNTETIFISMPLLPCIIVYLIMMYGGIRGLTGEDFGLEKYLEKSGNATKKNTVRKRGLFLCLVVSSILFTVTDIVILNNIGSLQDSQLTKVLLGISLIPQSIFTLAYGIYYNKSLTQIILLGIDLKTIRPLTIVVMLCFHITIVHVAFFLGARGYPDGLEY